MELTLDEAKIIARENWVKYKKKKERWKNRNVPKWIRDLDIPYFFPPDPSKMYVLIMPQKQGAKVSFSQVEIIETRQTTPI